MSKEAKDILEGIFIFCAVLMLITCATHCEMNEANKKCLEKTGNVECLK